jgi:membrane-bound ClpP family serine protease
MATVPENDDAFSLAFNRLVDRNIETLIQSKKVAIEEQGAMARWLIASLLAINSGGLFFVGGLKFPLGCLGILGASAFIFGILTAMLNAYLIQVLAMKSIAPLEAAISYWTIIVDPKHESPDRLAELSKQRDDAAKWSNSAPIAGWVSVLAFLAGVFAVGSMLTNAPTSTPSVVKIR